MTPFVCSPLYRVASLLGYRPNELLGRSIYDLCHTLDTNCLNKNHLNCKCCCTKPSQMHPLLHGRTFYNLSCPLQCVWRASPSVVSTGWWWKVEVMSGLKVTAPSSPAAGPPGPDPWLTSPSASWLWLMCLGEVHWLRLELNMNETKVHFSLYLQVKHFSFTNVLHRILKYVYSYP